MNTTIPSYTTASIIPVGNRLCRLVFLQIAAVLTGLWICLIPCTLAADPVYRAGDRLHPVFAPHGMVATQEATATRIGVEVLERGGNAVDAAVAVGFTLAVTLPRAGNLGGGGFMLIHSARDRQTWALDFRETAPAAAHRDLFLTEQGEVDPSRARFSHQSVAVPGTVAGLTLALERFGSRPLAELLAPAIRLADQGFAVTADLSATLQQAKPLALHPESRRIFFKPDGSPYQPGERLLQKDLAASLRAIAEQGAKAFYEGEIARKIATDMAANGGLITLDDLRLYRPLLRPPVRGTYRGYEIVSMPPPSSGGVLLVQLLNVLENFPLGELGHNSAATVHRMAEAMKLAYADRSVYLGDPAFTDVPVAGLTSKEYAHELAQQIDPQRARPAADIRPGNPPSPESKSTTHYTVVDRDGNAVVVTYTLNLRYGSGIVAAGTGILLNNEMDDFSAKPGVPNAFGLIGDAANAIAPGKRPLSSMSPTLVFKDGQLFLATGSPGGSRIITTVLQILLNVIDHGLNIAEATVAPRIHHQWLPDELQVEQGLSPDTLRLLTALGYKVMVGDAFGSTHSIMRGSGGWYGFSDTRQPGTLTAGY